MGSKRRSAPDENRQTKKLKLYKGVRRRKWGKWVVEVRIPKETKRIWLGSYDSPEKAARAYDAVQYCFHGSNGRFNFPDDKRPEIPFIMNSRPLLEKEIDLLKKIAASFAIQIPTVPSLPTSQVSLNAPDLEELPVESEIENADVVESETENADVVGGESLFAPAAGVVESSPFDSSDDMNMEEWIDQLFCDDI